jgi:plastocyanin
MQVPFARGWARTFVSAVASTALIVACSSGGPAQTLTTSPAPPSAAIISPTATTVASPSLTPAATARKTELASVTTFLASAPKGAIAVSMAGPPPHYVPATFTARSGDVTLFVTNGSHAAHDIAIDREPLQYSADRVTNLPLAVSSLIDVGTSATFVVKARPGGHLLLLVHHRRPRRRGHGGDLRSQPLTTGQRIRRPQRAKRSAPAPPFAGAAWAWRVVAAKVYLARNCGGTRTCVACSNE